MKFGVCVGYQESEHILSWGYDYIELNLCQLAQIDEATFTDMRQTLEKAGIQAESFNSFSNPEPSLRRYAGAKLMRNAASGKG